jgi:hypothetical protein
VSAVQDFEEQFRKLFVKFLVTVSPWFALDISQGVITLRLDKGKAMGAEARLRLRRCCCCCSSSVHDFALALLHLPAYCSVDALGPPPVFVLALSTPVCTSVDMRALHTHQKSCGTSW